MLDVTAAGIEGFNLGGVNVEPEHRDTGTGELQGQREADVTEADDGDVHIKKAEKTKSESGNQEAEDRGPITED